MLPQVDINPESRAHVTPGAARPELARDGWRTFLVTVRNQAGVTAGPEYLVERQTITIPKAPPPSSSTPRIVTCTLRRWIDPAGRGWYSGDHHIHAAGCLHYETPTQGVLLWDMWKHILGEGLNVGSVLTWGPGYYYQKQVLCASRRSAEWCVRAVDHCWRQKGGQIAAAERSAAARACDHARATYRRIAARIRPTDPGASVSAPGRNLRQR